MGIKILRAVKPPWGGADGALAHGILWLITCSVQARNDYLIMRHIPHSPLLRFILGSYTMKTYPHGNFNDPLTYP